MNYYMSVTASDGIWHEIDTLDAVTMQRIDQRLLPRWSSPVARKAHNFEVAGFKSCPRNQVSPEWAHEAKDQRMTQMPLMRRQVGNGFGGFWVGLVIGALTVALVFFGIHFGVLK